jgi:hypothetical protein
MTKDSLNRSKNAGQTGRNSVKSGKVVDMGRKTVQIRDDVYERMTSKLEEQGRKLTHFVTQAVQEKLDREETAESKLLKKGA